MSELAQGLQEFGIRSDFKSHVLNTLSLGFHQQSGIFQLCSEAKEVFSLGSLEVSKELSSSSGFASRLSMKL